MTILYSLLTTTISIRKDLSHDHRQQPIVRDIHYLGKIFKQNKYFCVLFVCVTGIGGAVCTGTGGAVCTGTGGAVCKGATPSVEQ
jgi:hypothetical protein